MRRLIVVATIFAGFAYLAFPGVPAAQTAIPAPLQLERKIPLGSVAGRIDHMAIDVARHRLFVAELGNDTVGVVDLDAHKVIRRISGLKEPQGVAYVQSNDSLYVANGGDGSVRVFHGPDYAPTGRIDLGTDADNIRVDAKANQLLIGYGSGAIGVIDPGGNKIKSFALNAHPESFQLDAPTHQIFVNLPNTRSIVVLDQSTGQERITWPLRYGGNFPMALDHERQLVFVVFRNPAKFSVFSWQTDGMVAEVDTCGDADDLFLDQKLRRIYISCGEGAIDVLNADDPKYPRITRFRTISGARTALFVPEMDRLMLAVRARFTEPASIWVYYAAP